MPKLKSDINSEYFHKKYIAKYSKLINREYDSHILYNQILRYFFEYIKQRMYDGSRFDTPIGFFEIRRIKIKPKDSLYRKDESQPLRTFIDKVVYLPNPFLDGRYKFNIIQEFRNIVRDKYDLQKDNISSNS